MAKGQINRIQIDFPAVDMDDETAEIIRARMRNLMLDFVKLEGIKVSLWLVRR